jgi:hypothetical protein
MTTTEVLRMAREALQRIPSGEHLDLPQVDAAIEAIDEVLRAAADGNPVGYVWQSALDKLKSGEAAHIRLWGAPEEEPGEVALYAAAPSVAAPAGRSSCQD